MKTPIFDFVKKYADSSPLRMHMPGHKGKGFLGIEHADITEIEGADVLYHEDGILKESQENASKLFGTEKTLYSTEGATLCIRGMLAMVQYYAKEQGEKAIIAATRNAHKSFITSCALLDLEPIWIDSDSDSLLSCDLSPKALSDFFSKQREKPTAVYVTSPDYLGNMLDIFKIANVCHENGSLLVVDNAHGAYLHFLPDACHPLDLGADLVCDSAHKTLSVLTGGAYLHISKSAPKCLKDYGQLALSLFSSTSPSYLILQSLDLCNRYLADHYSEKLYEFSASVFDLKKNLRRMGYQIIGNEPLKITILTKPYGYLGNEFAKLLEKNNVFVEFSDPDFVVMMLTSEHGIETLERIAQLFSEVEAKDPILEFPPKIAISEKVCSTREALLSPSEKCPIIKSENRILAQPGVTCPPAIPIAICGERITKEHILAFQYYGIKEIFVKK